MNSISIPHAFVPAFSFSAEFDLRSLFNMSNGRIDPLLQIGVLLKKHPVLGFNIDWDLAALDQEQLRQILHKLLEHFHVDDTTLLDYMLQMNEFRFLLIAIVLSNVVIIIDAQTI